MVNVQHVECVLVGVLKTNMEAVSERSFLES